MCNTNDNRARQAHHASA